MKSRMESVFHRFVSGKYSAIWLWAGFALIFLGSFFVVTSEVQEASHGKVEIINSIDHYFISIVAAIRNPMLNGIAVDITALGSATVLSIFLISSSLLLVFKKRVIDTVQLFASATGSALFTLLMKPFFDRPRPIDLARLVDVQGYSYPSGHSLSSAAVYFTFAILLSRFFQKWSHRCAVMGLSVFIIFFIALSRVYLGVHYFSDVLAGILVGIGWAALLVGVRFYLELMLK